MGYKYSESTIPFQPPAMTRVHDTRGKVSWDVPVEAESIRLNSGIIPQVVATSGDSFFLCPSKKSRTLINDVQAKRLEIKDGVLSVQTKR